MPRPLSLRRNILIICEGIGDKKFINAVMLGRIRSAHPKITIKFDPAGGRNQSFINTAKKYELSLYDGRVFVFPDADEWNKDKSRKDAMEEELIKHGVPAEHIIPVCPCNIEGFILKVIGQLPANQNSKKGISDRFNTVFDARKAHEASLKHANLNETRLRQFPCLEPWWTVTDALAAPSPSPPSPAP